MLKALGRSLGKTSGSLPMAGGILPREPPGRSLGKTSGSPLMAGGILPGFCFQRWEKCYCLSLTSQEIWA
jgi:hypothetical protein